jgi:hypothetical protein
MPRPNKVSDSGVIQVSGKTTGRENPEVGASF